MPWAGSAGAQVFTRTMGVSAYDGATCWEQTDAAVRGIRSDDHDYHDQDIAQGISNALHKGGGNTAHGNLRMGGFKLTGLAAGTAAGDSVRFEQLESGVLTTRGDMMYRGAFGVTRLAHGPIGTFLTVGANTDPAWTGVGSAIYYNTGDAGHTIPFLDGENTWSEANSFAGAVGFGGGVYGATTYFGDNNFVGVNTFTVSQYSNTGAFDLHGWIFSRSVYLNTSAILIDNIGGPISVDGRLQAQFLYNGNYIGKIKALLSVSGAGEIHYQSLSDGRLKQGVTPLVSGDVIDRLNPIRYRLSDDDDEPERIGFSAQELYEVVPQAASPGKGEPGDEDFTPWMRSMGALEPTIIAELKALRRRVAELEAHVAA